MISNKIRNVMQARFRGFDAHIQEISELDHSGTNGDLRENLLKGVLTDVLPKRFVIRSGFICDLLGAVSPQLDIIIIDRQNTPELILESDVAFVPVESALAVIEVKASLHTGQKGALSQVEKQIREVLALRVAKNPEPNVSLKYSVPFLLFAFNSNVSDDTLSTWFETQNNVRALCVWRDRILFKADGKSNLQKSDGCSEELLMFCSFVVELAEQTLNARFGQVRNTYHYLRGLPDDWAT